MSKSLATIFISLVLVTSLVSVFTAFLPEMVNAQTSGYSEQPILWTIINQSYPMTGTFYSPEVNVARFDSAEIQYSVAFTSSDPNATTVTLQYSNDAQNWFDKVLLSGVTTTTNVLTNTDVLGAVWRVKVETSNASVPAQVYVSAVLE